MFYVGIVFFIFFALGVTPGHSRCVYNKRSVEWGPCNPKMQMKTKVANLIRGHSKCPMTWTYRKPCDIGSITINGCKYVQVSDWSECDKDTKTHTRALELLPGEAKICDNTTVESKECGQGVKSKKGRRKSRRGGKRRKKNRRKNRRKKNRKQKKNVCKYDVADVGPCDTVTQKRLVSKSLRGKNNGKTKCDLVIHVTLPCEKDPTAENFSKSQRKKNKMKKKRRKEGKSKGKRRRKKDRKRTSKRNKKQERKEEIQKPPALTEYWVQPYTTSVVVAWTPPELESSDSPVTIDGYQIVYWQNISEVHSVEVNASLRSYAIENLEPGGEYVIKIRAMNKAGLGPALYDTVRLRDLEAADTLKAFLPPIGLKSQVLSPTAINVSWVDKYGKGSEQQAGKVFYLRYRRLKHQWTDTRTLKTTYTYSVLKNLLPKTKYEFEVLSSDGKQNSTWSARIWNTTRKSEITAKLPQVPELKISVFHSSLFLVWRHPKQDSFGSVPVIDGYKISYGTTRFGLANTVMVNASVNNFVIKGLEPDKPYFVNIEAFNGLGTGPARYETVFLEKSKGPLTSDSSTEQKLSTPRVLKLKVMSSSAINVSWEDPSIKRDSQNSRRVYYVRYRQLKQRSKANKQHQGGWKSLKSSKTHLVIKKLLPNSKYEFAVITSNGERNSSISKPVWSATKQSKFSQEPPRLKEFWVRPYTTFVDVSWKPPEQESSDHPVDIDGYQIGYGRGFPDVHIVTVNASVFSYRIKDLVPGGEYVISIRAVNIMGISPAMYDTVILRDEEEDTPKKLLPSVGLRSTVTSSSAINVSWVDVSIKEKERLEDRVYFLRYRQLKRQSKSPTPFKDMFRISKTTNTYMVVQNLLPYTKYEFAVSSSDGKQNSTWSIMIWNITGQAVPGDSPKDLTVNIDPDFPEQIILSWQPPSQPNGIITGYEILYTTSASKGPPITEALTVLGSKLSTKLTTLVPGSRYNLSIRAMNIIGVGPPLVINNYKIPGHSVLVPATLKVSKVPSDPRAVLLQWQIPEHITTQGFDILYSTNMEGNPIHWKVEKKFGMDLKEAVLKNLDPGTRYFFKVRAQTPNGYGSESNTVVTETPKAPYQEVPADIPTNLQVKILSSTSAIASWQDPGMAKVIEMRSPYPQPTYTVRYRSLESEPDQYETATLHYSPLYVDDLQPMTQYEFSVRVKWEDGEESPWTDPVVGTTLASDSFQHPLKAEVKGLADSPRVAVVSWQPHTDSKIKEYVVLYSMDPSKPHKKWIQKAAVPQDVKQEVFNSLKEDSTYFFFVQAMTDLGFGPRSKVVSYTTPKATKIQTPLAKPEKVIVTVVSANAVILNWHVKGFTYSREKVKDTEKVRIPLTFTVRYKDIKSKISQYRYTSIPSPSLILFGLRPSTTYEFSVKVNRGERHSDWSVPVKNSTLESAPGSPPRKLKVSMDNGDPTSVIVSWKAPRQSNGKIMGYRLVYTEDPKFQVENSNILDIAGSKKSQRVSFLKPQKNFHFRLRAHTKKGQGPVSDPVTYKTPKVFGSAPEDVTVTTSPDNSYDVLVSWQPPASPKNKIKYYTITHYTEEGKQRHVEQVPGSTLTYMVKGLQASTTYHFSLQAHYRKGAGPHSDVVKYSIPKELIQL